MMSQPLCDNCGQPRPNDTGSYCPECGLPYPHSIGALRRELIDRASKAPRQTPGEHLKRMADAFRQEKKRKR